MLISVLLIHTPYSHSHLDTQIDQYCADECGCDTSVPLTWMPARSGVLSGLTEAFDFSNAVNTFTNALAGMCRGGLGAFCARVPVL